MNDYVLPKTLEAAKNQIIYYINTHKKVTTIELVHDLHLDPIVFIKAIESLEKEGKLKGTSITP